MATLRDFRFDVDTQGLTEAESRKVIAGTHSVIRFPDGSVRPLEELIGAWWTNSPDAATDNELIERSTPLLGCAVIADDGTPVPITGVRGRVGFLPGPQEMVEIQGDEIVAFVAHDILGDERYVIDPTGRIRLVAEPDNG